MKHAPDSLTADLGGLRIAAIVPAWNARATIGACLAALRAQSRPLDDIILFDDGSTDGTADIARNLGVRVITNSGAPVGPAGGRNRAAADANADLLLFVDADVVLAPYALERLVTPLAEPDVAATFGSYDSSPPSRRLSSVYVNLRHHFTHQNGEREAHTFWSGIGLVRRQPFFAVGGFDPVLFPHPSIEDVELGARIRASGGRIRLVPEAQGAHWKDWRLTQLLHADIFRRAIPWSRLIADGRAASDALNLSNAERAKAMLAGGVFLALLLSLMAPRALFAAAAIFALYVAVNWPFLSLVGRMAGFGSAAAAAVLHCCYHFYSAATYVLVNVATRLRRLKPRRGKIRARTDKAVPATRRGS